MKNDYGFERIDDRTFKSIDEWVHPTPKQSVIFDFLSALLGGYQIYTPYEPAKAMDRDKDMLYVDISKELRLLGYPESEINRWTLIKKIEQRTGKQCDDYL